MTRGPHDAPRLARVHLVWDALLRPALRAHAAHVTATQGTRPRPCDLFVVFGVQAWVASLLALPLAPSRAAEVVAVVGSRAHPEDLVHPQVACDVAEVLATFTPGETVLLWIGETGVDAVGLDVVDTGPEGDRIHTPSAAGGTPS